MNDEFNICDFKKELNTLMIMYGPPDLSIGQAEDLMRDFCTAMERELLKGMNDQEPVGTAD